MKWVGIVNRDIYWPRPKTFAPTPESPLPPIKKDVLVLVIPEERGCSMAIAVGYRKDAAGDPECPYFVVPGVPHQRVVAWCDVLDEDWDIWKEAKAAVEQEVL